MSILPIALVCSLTFAELPETHWCMHACRISHQVHYSSSPLESISVRMMWWASFTGLYQYATSMTDLLTSNETQVAKHTMIQTLISQQYSHKWWYLQHGPQIGVICYIIPFYIRWMPWSQSHPYRGKCPTSFPHTQNTFPHVMTSGISGMALLHFHQSLLRFPLDLQPQHLSTIF